MEVLGSLHLGYIQNVVYGDDADQYFPGVHRHHFEVVVLDRSYGLFPIRGGRDGYEAVIYYVFACLLGLRDDERAQGEEGIERLPGVVHEGDQFMVSRSTPSFRMC